MVARTLAAAPLLAESVLHRLGGSASTHVPSRPQSLTASQETEPSSREEGHGPNGDELAAGVWGDLWPLDRQQQRAFFCFGMEVLLKVLHPSSVAHFLVIPTINVFNLFSI